MSLSVYTYPNNPRVWKAQIAGKFTGVEVNEVPNFQFGVTNKTKEFLALNPLGKVPTLVTPEGPVWESNAIASYVAHAKPSQLFGSSQYEAALVEQWVHFASNEIDLPAAAWLYPIWGLVAENPEATNKARSDIRSVLDTLNNHLADRTFLVGERVTFADIAVSMSLLPLYKMVLDAGFRKAFVNTNRWFNTLINQPQFASVIKDFTFAAKMAKAPKAPKAAASTSKKQTAPKKQAAKKEAPKKEAAAAAPAPAAVAADAPAKPNIRQIFAALPKAEYPSLAPFKTTYCNEEWSTSKAEFAKDIIPAVARGEYSLWLTSYKYPAENKKLFMSSNMIGGLFQRLEQGRDYALGSMLIFGEEESEAGLEIIGAFIIRGTELPEFIYDGPDFIAFDWRKIDPQTTDDIEFFQDLLGWEGSFAGKKWTEAGKIFK
eukprot:CAMPEP_0174232326 /NCGR_PEP_ID=MMETSP0417-20130205/2640_1 /TAXON_ID=242541 /ORGANISM="Mayorella sp, Strain BSH-02190019" /LENGTH=430 /DNA_ID=CAMNT_0015310355 /DNA_START=134 /DNA_END=1426 /DNA_ORIENTATION=+